MRIALVHAPLLSAISDLALGHQTPLGLLMVAGPLVDDGSEVELFDAAREHWTDAEVVNPARPPRNDLEGCSIAWELIRDWDKYRAFGHGRTAVVQFSRGCPHRCTYCGQWAFWQRWRHRDETTFVDELEFLRREHDVRFFWFADENPTTQKRAWKSLLEEIVRRDLRVGMTASIASSGSSGKRGGRSGGLSAGSGATTATSSMHSI